MSRNIAALALTLHDIGAIQFGRFRLHSGRESRIYIDLRVLVSFPDALRQATAAYRTVLDGLPFDLLVATPLAGLPIGTALCLDMDRPLIYPRKTAKSYGTGKNIEGRYVRRADGRGGRRPHHVGRQHHGDHRHR